MSKLFRDCRGFTLVELMITIVIVGVLAAVAIPLYQSNVKRAKASEADAALGSIRTALRVYYAENARYPGPYTAKQADSIDVDITGTDLNGTYFVIGDYTYTSPDCVAYTIFANNTTLGITRQLDENGTLSN